MDYHRKSSGLNVFEFPSETDTRFLLFILAAIFLAINTGQNIDRTLSVLTEEEYETIDYHKGNQSTEGTERTYEENLSYNREIFFSSLKSSSIQFLFVIILFATALIIYKKYPSKIIRRNGLRIADYQRDEQFHREISEISRRSNIPGVTIYSSGSIMSANAQAFGFSKNPMIRIEAGLRILLRKSRQMFDAILSHEFGHIMNKDIAKTYFTQSLWLAAIMIFIIPLLIFIFLNFFYGVYLKIESDGLSLSDLQRILTVNVPSVIKIILQFTALFLLLAYARASVLRIREYYADQRVVESGFAEGLLQVLKQNSGKNKPGIFKRLFSLHPSPSERVQAVYENTRLFKLRGELFFVCGLLLAIIINGLFYPLISIALFASSVFGFGAVIENNYTLSYFIILLGFLIPAMIIYAFAFLISFFISQTIAMQTVKHSYVSTYLTRTDSNKYILYLKFSIIFVAGCELGFWILPISTLIPLNFLSFVLIILIQIFFAFIIFMSLSFSDFIGLKLLNSRSIKLSITNKFRLTSLINSFVLSFFVFITFALRVYMVQNF